MPPHKQYFTNSFLTAAVTCAIISIVMMCLPPASLTFAALGILFAILSKRNELVMKPAALITVGTCMMAITFDILFFAIGMWLIFTNPEQRKQFAEVYDEMYMPQTGMSFEETIQQFKDSFTIEGLE